MVKAAGFWLAALADFSLYFYCTGLEETEVTGFGELFLGWKGFGLWGLGGKRLGDGA